MMLASLVDEGSLDDPAQPRRLDQIGREAAWMRRLVHRRREQAETVPVDLGEVMTDIWQSVSASRTSGLRMVREPALWVVADPDELGRSIRNLMDNAIRAAGEAGVVEVRVEGHRWSVALEVNDSGPGFGRVEGQQRLGLLTVYQFAAEHQGLVMVSDSALGGASVRLVIPRVETPGAGTRTRTPA
jgi:signal transduction histidine kinase